MHNILTPSKLKEYINTILLGMSDDLLFTSLFTKLLLIQNVTFEFSQYWFTKYSIDSYKMKHTNGTIQLQIHKIKESTTNRIVLLY